MGKKELLAKVLQSTGALSIMRRLDVRDGREVRILAYHRVFDIAKESDFPFDPELISASTANFKDQIQHVATHFVPITCADLLAAIDSGRSLPRRAIIITFDDGYADNYTHAFPVLRSLGVPATIFLATAYIGGTEIFWFDRVANIVFRAPSGDYPVPGIREPLRLADIASRRLASKVVLRHMKGLPDLQRRELINWLSELLKTECPADDPTLSEAMTWAQVREMASAGFEFGSHTASHPLLTQLDDIALDRELAESRDAIAGQLGRPVNIFSYPDGGAEAFDPRVIAAVKRAGYQLGLSYVSGASHLHSLNRYAIQRLHVERYTSRTHFQAMLEFPTLFN